MDRPVTTGETPARRLFSVVQSGVARGRVKFLMPSFSKVAFLDNNGGIDTHSSFLNAALYD
jgi:hypothetical protein